MSIFMSLYESDVGRSKRTCQFGEFQAGPSDFQLSLSNRRYR